MNEQQGVVKSCLPRAAAALAVFVFGAALSPDASALSLSVNRAYVSNKKNCSVVVSAPPGFICPASLDAPGVIVNAADFYCRSPHCGNISNDPHVEFESDYKRGLCFNDPTELTDPGFYYASTFNGTAFPPPGLEKGNLKGNVCNDGVFFCGAITCNSVPGNIDELSYEIFKFQDGSNPLDPGSTPPLRTFFVDNPGNCTNIPNQTLPTRCVLFDGNINILGDWAKSNGQYGFRVKAQTQIQQNGSNITITAIRAYPSGATQDGNSTDCPGNVAAGEAGSTFGRAGGCYVSQKPVTVDVTNVHVVRASSTLVGQINGVLVQPYTMNYRLSKDATMFITVDNSAGGKVRTILPGLPRLGEGTPVGTVTNGDSWNGRFDNGDLAPPGVYLLTLQAFSQDQYGRDLSFATTRQIDLDAMQITDFRTQPLQQTPTSQAFLTFMLTEAATTYVDIYPPGTQFCSTTNAVGTVADPLNNVNSTVLDVDPAANPQLPPKTFSPHTGACTTGAGAAIPEIAPLRSFIEYKEGRRTQQFVWDGRDKLGNLLPDGDYVYVAYAALTSQNGFPFNGNANNKRIWTSKAGSGFLPIARGLVAISPISVFRSVVGSTPQVTGLNPFVFQYTLSRDAIVTMRIFDVTGSSLVKTLVNGDLRPGGTASSISEKWEDATDNNGRIVSSGTYLVQLLAADPALPSKVSTTTASFGVNLFRITDIGTSPLLSGASDQATISYVLSQSMSIGLNIYPPGTQVQGSTSTWPPCGKLEPGLCNQVVGSGGTPVAPLKTVKGMRPGRRTQTETWDGRDQSGLSVPDGVYIFTLAAQSTTTPKYFATDKIMGTVNVVRGEIIFNSFTVKPDVPPLFNSSATITLHPFSIEYSLSRQSSVTVQIFNTAVPPAVIRTVVLGETRDAGILIDDVWDGRDDKGNFPRPGLYTVRVVAEDTASQLTSPSTFQLTISYNPLRIYDVAVTALRGAEGTGVIGYQVSEPMKVAIKIYRPGTAFDAAGNPSPPESTSLVKRIIGIKQARVQVEEFWNGTDLRDSKVPDGNYRFRIIGSTDPTAIDDISGNALKPASLSQDQFIEDIPVVRSPGTDAAAEFAANSYFYPNPATAQNMFLQIFVPVQAKVTLKMFNIAGELVFTRDFGEWPTGSCVQDLLCNKGIQLAKLNQSGRPLGRGLYYAVIRADETLGGKTVLQTIKKILIP